ncbi:HAD hydrolase family protein [Aquihabitans sp. G128]|uniref:HAD hydrolase family protein n=1 Tax=Aquihabitans sp. G128 TaxID=2849779 RepID=UPI001C23135B|nr:HAD hydrolase family protein [Aquihabitans sp. G128]QXC61420.1 HAD hydrolase family protein [Aquihabitans sp. G128]
MLPLICLDVDGTLVGSTGAPTEVLWAAAAEARERGQRLTLCTARLAAGPTREWAARLDPEGWHSFHTGAARWNPATDEVRTHALGAEVIDACTAIAGERGWVLETYSWDDYVVDSDDPLAARHAALLGLPAVRRPVSDLVDPVVRVQFVVPIAEAGVALAAAPPGCAASAATSPVMADAAFVSITLEGVSKAGGIAEIAADLGVGMDRVMMVGDGHNDLSAVQAVGWGVAMANAEPELIAAARLTVGHVDDDGAAEAIRRSADLG